MKYIDASPFTIAGARSLISALVVVAYMVLAKYRFRISGRAAAAGISLWGCVTCFVIANKMTTAANAIVLQYIAPAFVLVVSAVFLGQKLKKMEVGVVGLTFCGIILFFIDELDLGSMLGNGVAILSGIFMGAMFIFNSRIGDMAEKMSGILIAHVLTAAVGLPVGAIASPGGLEGTEYILILVLGVFQLGIPYVLYARASSLISPLACSLIGMAEPLLNPVWVAVFYGEIPGLFAFAGGIIVIGAVIIYNIWDEKENRKIDQKV